MRKIALLATVVLVLSSFVVAQAPPPPPAPTPQTTAPTPNPQPAPRDVVTVTIPPYPPLAQQARIEDRTIAHISVARDGTVTHVRIVRAHPMLTQAVVDALRYWKFAACADNAPCSPEQRIEIEFKVDMSLAPGYRSFAFVYPGRAVITAGPPVIEPTPLPASPPQG